MTSEPHTSGAYTSSLLRHVLYLCGSDVTPFENPAYVGMRLLS